jgi:hypothetical protein
MANKIIGLIVTGEMTCDNCGRTMRHPERYAFLCDEEKGTESHICEKCSREKGYLKKKKNERGEEIETFL